jgi:S1-C subfamily serine protease
MGLLHLIYTEEESIMNKNILEEFSNAMADAVEHAGKATALVNARNRIPSSGIGYAADLILTADHAIEREEDISVSLFDGSQVGAKLAGRHPSSDLALLKLERSASPIAEPVTTPARIGQIVLALGRPSSAGIEASLGVISAIDGPVRTVGGGMLERYIRTDTIAYPGFSGGPLVDAGGQVAGVNTSGFGRGVSLTIPADLAWHIAGLLAQHGQVRRAYLGVRSQPVELPESSKESLKQRQSSGLLIVNVENGSPAAHGGLMVGDILVGIGNMPIRDHDQLFTQLGIDLVGKKEKVEILRGGQLLQVDILFKER